MKRIFMLSAALIIILVILAFFYPGFKKSSQLKIINNKSIMKITSPAFVQGEIIPKKYTCDGQNANPELIIQGAPESSKSLLLIVDDPDSPRGVFTHWILYNIDPKTTKIQENSAPSGAINGKNDFGNEKYGGPCPGTGTHRYFFTIMALDKTLNIAAGTDRNFLDKEIEGHVIDSAQLMGKYARD